MTPRKAGLNISVCFLVRVSDQKSGNGLEAGEVPKQGTKSPIPRVPVEGSLFNLKSLNACMCICSLYVNMYLGCNKRL